MNTKRHYRWIILSMVVLAALLSVNFQVAKAATNRYVDANIGVDSGDCSNNLSPCLTISYAVSQSIAGDTIYVAAGTYTGNISIDKSLTLLGDPGDASAGPGANSPIVDGGSAPGSAFFIENGVSNVVIQGFEMRNFTSNATGVGNGISAWEASTSNITIQDNYFHNLEYNGVLVGNDGAAGDHTNWLIKDNIAANIDYIAFELTNTSNSSIEENVIHLSTPDIGAIFSSARRSETGLTIKNNLIDGTPSVAYPVIYIYAYDVDMANPNLNSVLIEGNTISTSGTPYQIYISNIGTGTITNVEIHGNSISNLKNTTAAQIDAENNYWGTVFLSEILPNISGSVDWSPWCNSNFSVCTYSWSVHNTTQGTDHITIQAGIDAATAGDEIHIDAGTFIENVVVNKSLTLAGAGMGSTIVYPAVSNPNPCSNSSLCGTITSSSNVIGIQSSNVTIQDLTIDGDNPSLTSGIVRGVADLDARNGLITDHSFSPSYSNLEVHHVEVKNIYLRGMYASTNGTFNFHHNTVTNVQGDGGSIGMFAWYGPGIMANNTVSYANDAISANHSKGIQFLNNTVTNSGSGVHTDNNGDGGGVADLIQGNVVSDCAPNGYGVWAFAARLNVLVDSNSVNNCAVGLTASGQYGGRPQFTNNEVDGENLAGSTGLYVTTSLFGWGSANSVADFSGNIIKNNQDSLYFESEDGYSLEIGLYGNAIYGNTNGASEDGEGTYLIDASANWWGDNTPAGVAAEVSSSIDYTPWLASGTDTAPGTFGFQGDFSSLWVDDDSPQTGSTGRIQEGINLVSGSTVNVAAGTYTEQLVIDESLTLVGAGAATTIVQAPATLAVDSSGSRNLVTITGSGVSADVSGFTFQAPGSTTLDVGIFVRDTAFADLHDNIVTNLGTKDPNLGILVGRKFYSTTGTASISSNTISGYTKGGIVVDNSGSSATVTGNTITGNGVDPVVAMNGIQISRLATGTLTGNTVSGHVCTSVSGGCTDDPTTSITADGASGILLYVSGAVSIEGNTLSNNQYGIWSVASTSLAITNNAIDGGGGGSGRYGISIWDSDQWTVALGFSETATVATMTGNTLSTHAIGLMSKDYTAGGAVPDVTASNNSLTGNLTFGAWSNVALNASGNWWGDDIPSGVAAEVSANVDYTPWLAVGTDTGDPGFQGDFSTLWVEDDSPQTGSIGRIQEGINLVSGSTVYISAGTYTEQLVINKDLDLTGIGNPVIKAPTVVSYYTFPEGLTSQWEPVVLAFGGILSGSAITGAGQITVNISDLVVDGDSRIPSPTSRRAVGILYRNILGSVDGCIVQNMGYSTSSINSWSIMAYGTSDVVFSGNDVSGYAKGGFVVNGVASDPSMPKPNAVIDGNTVTGPPYDPLMTLAPNGIQIGWGATGSVLNNIVSQNGFPGTTWGGSGILIQSSPGVLVAGNTVTDSDYGISIAGYESFGGSTATGTIVQNNNVEDNDVGIYVSRRSIDTLIENNTITGNVDGIQVGSSTYLDVPPINTDIHANIIEGNSTSGLYVVTNVLQEVVDAEINWWGSACGPSGDGLGTGDAIIGNADYSPWWTAPGGPFTSYNGAGGALVFTSGSDTDSMQAIVDCAAPGSTLMYEGGPYDGGIVVDTDNLTFKLNSVTVGPGSPAYTINADDVTILGPGVFDGTGGTPASPAILVNAGADNFTLDGTEIKNWAHGVELTGSVASFKIVNNWIHDNAGSALLTTGSGTSLSGVVTIEGNLFKANGGTAVVHGGTGTLDVEYNSWGAYSGPVGIASNVDYAPWTYSEVFVDMVPDTLATLVGVNETNNFSVAVKVDARNLYAVQYRLSYAPAFLQFQGISDGPFKGTGTCVNNTSTPGVVSVYCTRFVPDGEVDNHSGETISTITFKATGSGLSGNGPWTTHLDLSVLPTELSSGAKGGIKVFVNNGGFGAPSGDPGHTITDAEDGQVNITGVANFTGYIDLQGRANDSGGTLKVYNQQLIAGATAYASGTSASSGKFTTAYLGPYQLTVPSTYYFQVDAPLFLPTTALATSPSFPSLPTQWLNGDVLDPRPLTTLLILQLLGGDANDNNGIDVSDLGCIGWDYGTSNNNCGSGNANSDVNGDGVVNIYDLVLVGGNYDKTSSGWTQAP